MPLEYAFEIATAAIRFGFGVTREVGAELADLGKSHVLVFADPNLRTLPPLATVQESLQEHKIRFSVFDRVHIEPTDESLREATAAAQAEDFDAFVAVGGGSTMDTAKAANLYSCYPADLLDYVNPPIGKGLPVPGPLKPLIAIPTTAGTGSETTGVAIFDLCQDARQDRHRPPPAQAHAGPDRSGEHADSATRRGSLGGAGRVEPRHRVLHRTALPPAPATRTAHPAARLSGVEPHQRCLEPGVAAPRVPLPQRAVRDPSDDEARASMMLAAAFAGIGFGNAGVHLPHGMSYPVSGLVRGYRAPGYAVDHALVPHGVSVILNAPAVYRFVSSACPERHLRAAEILGAKVDGARRDDAGKILADRIVQLMRDLHLPNGLRALGYETADIPRLVEGTLPQHRVTKLSPRPAGPEDLARLFEEAMVAW